MATGPGQSPISHASQDLLQVVDVISDLLLTRDGTVCLIVKTSSVNFDLLSEDEQDVKIMSFGSMVNSLDFQLQVLIETKKINISKYSDYLDTLDTPDLSPGLKRQFSIYKHFIRNLITNKEILDKRFMIVIPYRTMQPIDKNTTTEQKLQMVENSANYLYPKKYHIIKMLKGMGLDGEQMTTSEIVKYFYSIYNPASTIELENLPQIYV
ncbi:hypothetical protein IT418_03765 [bacterium]|nr:hypothetical protein [bacterium]